ncbi:uncharacterized protein PAN0_016d5376 [Moesziomyces antarcticus]|uniref:Uncharacterized protein n=2 Tax=Pseudozyma antarctica TaxID=84753 RepID=A0A5C3FVZ2_PSEA2|nr:uncharacterized protein PAN0_016d5376 [Moesziomyces antarcticus]GAK67150.1 hypothetical protein PAN0_016d5376 [Moesziomyces antarcticus]SPO48406.1 uncharacterized protein PSANT_06097 [Moesziomyces antarcticus]
MPAGRGGTEALTLFGAAPRLDDGNKHGRPLQATTNLFQAHFEGRALENIQQLYVTIEPIDIPFAFKSPSAVSTRSPAQIRPATLAIHALRPRPSLQVNRDDVRLRSSGELRLSHQRSMSSLPFRMPSTPASRSNARTTTIAPALLYAFVPFFFLSSVDK